MLSPSSHLETKRQLTARHHHLQDQEKENQATQNPGKTRCAAFSQRPISSQSSISASNPSATPVQTPASSRPPSSTTRPTTGTSSDLTPAEDQDLAAREPFRQQKQCRICRKKLSTVGGLSAEPVHLCSNCRQLICDDCASYSASDQHWMCSSCRRRALNPPIPPEALKELGLNQNSSAVRRMTLRLNQNDLKPAVNKSSSESNTSSNSSSGCSSMSIQTVAVTTAQSAQTPITNTTASGNSFHLQQLPGRGNLANEQLSIRQTAQHQQRRLSQQPAPSFLTDDDRFQQSASGTMDEPGTKTAARPSNSMLTRKLAAQKTVSQPGTTKPRAPHQADQNQSLLNERQVFARSSHMQQAPCLPEPEAKRATLRLQQHSLSLSGNEPRASASARRASAIDDALQQQVANHPPAREASNRPPEHQAGLLAASGRSDVQHRHSISSLHPQQAMLAKINHQAQQQQRVQMKPSVHSELRRFGSSETAESATHQLWQQQLAPISAEQMHMRRLSDQSNMIRRSSIVSADPSPAGGSLVARNRSHSNIDSVASYFANSQQLNLGAGGGPQSNWQQAAVQGALYAMSDENIHRQHQSQLSLPQMQQRRLSDQWDERQRSLLHHSGQLRAAGSQHQMCSIITPYAQKRLSSDDLDHSGPDSSSGDELDAGSKVYGHYGSSQQLGQSQPRHPMSIPSVNVSEFRRNSLAQHSLRSSQQQLDAMAAAAAAYTSGYVGDQIDPTQINVATEQAIQQQQLQEQLQLQQLHQKQQLFPHFVPVRRGSSGRVLPRIPGAPNEQSRSLLELPGGGGAGRGGSAHDLSGPSSMGDAGHASSTLDLPSASPTIRRASAPEGQNIRIVVDDIDSSGPLHGYAPTPVAHYHQQGHSGQQQAPVYLQQQQRKLSGQFQQSAQQTYNYLHNGQRQHHHHQQQQQQQHQHLHQLQEQQQQQQNRQYFQQQQQRCSGAVASGGAGQQQHFGGRLVLHSGALHARAKPAGEFYERHILHRDDSLALECNGLNGPSAPSLSNHNDNSANTSDASACNGLPPTATNQVGREFGLHVMGGKLNQQDEKLHAAITWILPGGPASKVGLKPGDEIIEWDGKCLLDMSYEQVAEVIESSANIAELLVKPQLQLIEPGANYVRAPRRMSQQTERDLRQLHEQQQLFSLLNSYKPVDSDGILQQQQQQHQTEAGQRRARQVDGHPSGGGSGRAGTGRKLPQIPLCAPVQQQQQQQLQHFQQPPFNPLRHASTGQLEHTGLSYGAISATGGPFGHVSTGHATPGAPGETSRTNGGLHLLSAAVPADQQQQSRSAIELHRASITSLFGQHSQQRQQSQPPVQQHHQLGVQQQQQWANLSQQHHHFNYGCSPTVGGEAYGFATTVNHQLAVSSQSGRQLNGVYNSTNGAVPVDANEPCGLIGLQVNLDERLATLEISVLSAHNIDINPSLDYYVRMRILPESKQFKPCTTRPSSDMNWKETFLFQNVPVAQVQRMAIEIGIWFYDEAPRLSAEMAQPICEALIPIQSARERNIDFWPLHPPPSSPQTRRKSLNDLIGNQCASRQQKFMATQPSHLRATDRLTAAGKYQASSAKGASQAQCSPSRQRHVSEGCDGPGRAQSNSARMSPNDSPHHRASGAYLAHQRERSSSNRNLPEANKLQAQLRRASDELATSSSHRLPARVGPAASRRSISVINVGGDTQLSRSRLGSQANVFKAQPRRDSTSKIANGTEQPVATGATGGCDSPTGKIGYGSPARDVQPVQSSQHQVGYTPSGRRSSLVGIHSMSGYRSQKNSQSDATDHSESPLNSMAQASRTGREFGFAVAPSGGGGNTQETAFAAIGRPTRQQMSAGSSSRQSCSSNASSRRGSMSTAAGLANAVPDSHSQHHSQLQRRGSFAMQTLRKLKRTMSLTKGNMGGPSGSNQESRRTSSSSSDQSDASLNQPAGEDVAVARALKSENIVGRLKLSFGLSKGQFEVNVIAAQGLKFEHESAMGLYVKMYLKGRSRTNKRKTRLVQPGESPTFKQTIKYDGSLVDNKLLEISVWAKVGSLRGKVPIGLSEIRLSELDLGSQLQTTSWYNLHSMDALCSSSIED